MTTLGGITLLARRAQKLEREQTVTAADLLAEAVEKRRFPGRRFRVEGSPAGSSRLLTKPGGEAARARYGGKLVELITMPDYYKGLAVILSLPGCRAPNCGAQTGQPCMDGRVARRPHANRFGRADAFSALTEEAADLGPCDRCKVGPAIPCVTPTGKPRDPHRGRLTLEAAQAAGGAP